MIGLLKLCIFNTVTKHFPVPVRVPVEVIKKQVVVKHGKIFTICIPYFFYILKYRCIYKYFNKVDDAFSLCYIA